ncbi:hypothetical protein OV079_51405 [Nannocystis pusilla]|uniref:Uncharacterized protein n=1 Tax=Nannocystis pusilla TaxID=889268 RepID=A0A9X3F1V0_9BACT|nr:hypothetical protein [Nannocystis pusilla]MCY1013800.1 hypothetical protein [Nannocystis pusilla]
MHVRSDKLELVDGDSHVHVRKSLLEKVDDSVSRIVGGNEQARIAAASRSRPATRSTSRPARSSSTPATR